MQRRTIETVENAILEAYIKKPQPLSVKEIRGECKLSDTIIRRALYESQRIGRTHKELRIMSRDYPSMVHQHRSVVAFHPTRKWLAEVIDQTRREFDYHKYTSGRGFQ